MKKIPTPNVQEILAQEDIWSDEWADYVHSMHPDNWTDWDEHPWAWYMEKSTRKEQGWHIVSVNPKHKDVTVIYWLKSQHAKFKHSGTEFLIEDSKIATMAILKWA